MKAYNSYFPHDSDATDDPKILVLMADLGLEGYGIYWVVIEHLRKQPGFKSHLSVLRGLAIRHNSSEPKFKTVVERYGLFEIDPDENFFSLSLLNRMKPLEEKRKLLSEAGKKGNLKRWGNRDKKSPGDRHPIASKVKESKVKSINIPFDDFWNLYGRKVQRGKCEKKWARLVPAEREKIMDTLPRWLGVYARDPQYQPHPLTYLNQKRWEDEIISIKKGLTLEDLTNPDNMG